MIGRFVKLLGSRQERGCTSKNTLGWFWLWGDARVVLEDALLSQGDVG